MGLWFFQPRKLIMQDDNNVGPTSYINGVIYNPYITLLIGFFKSTYNWLEPTLHENDPPLEEEKHQPKPVIFWASSR